MKKNFLPAIRLTAVFGVFFAILYPLSIWGIAQLVPGKGRGLTISQNGQTYYANVGQSFSDDKYFWSRPSAVDYNAAGSGGSNKGPSNPEYLAEVQTRIAHFMAHNPGVDKSQIPSELVTASGSGLDPHISVPAARVQVQRIAQIRHLNESKIGALIEEHAEKPLLGLFGTEKINVLQLNLALDQLNTL
jgi:potassium-transporting ATPase KdpC subunit